MIWFHSRLLENKTYNNMINMVHCFRFLVEVFNTIYLFMSLSIFPSDFHPVCQSKHLSVTRQSCITISNCHAFWYAVVHSDHLETFLSRLQNEPKWPKWLKFDFLDHNHPTNYPVRIFGTLVAHVFIFWKFYSFS